MVGVILNLAIWFALHVLFGELDPMSKWGLTLDIPVLATINIPSLILTLGAMLAIFRFKVGMIPTLAGAAVLGVLYQLARGTI